MSTVVSSASAYCTPAQALNYHDARQWGDVLLDTDTRCNAVDLLTNPVLAALLLNASGEVESACLRKGIYNPEDLAGLTGAAQSMLQGMVAEIAFWRGTCRRHAKAELTPEAARQFDLLERLSKGERIFGLQEVMDAGVIDTTNVSQPQIDTLALATTTARRFFGMRNKERRLQF